MSMECDSSLFGVIRPPPPVSLIERGKRPKSEPEPELEKTEPKPKPKPKPAWRSKARSRNVSVFDAITPPRIAEWGKYKYNVDNQAANFVFLDVVKTTWSAVGMYYITFQAHEDPPNCSAKTFQAQVWENRSGGPHEVISCAIKT
ncbi:hypothetical protein P8452_25436 [Trifolium repens]|nr:hypothetical protein P8452_25436 [Trifolium repens]